MKRIYMNSFCVALLFIMVITSVDAQLVAHRRNIIVDDTNIDWTIKVQVGQFGQTVVDDFTANVVWANDGITEPTDGDSISVIGQYCCDSIINPDEINGNVAFIGRGLCNFDLKHFNAQEAGAISAIIGNRAPIGRDIGTHTNGMIWMAPVDLGDTIEISTNFISYEDRRAITNKLDNGPVEMTFDQNYMYDAAFGYAKSTPVESIRPLENISVVVTNLDTVDWVDVTFTCEITSPGGAMTVLTEIADTVESAQLFAIANAINTSGETQVTFDESYTPTEVGTYTAVFTVDVGDPSHPVSSESITMSFDITDDKTFALDHGEIVNEFGMAMEFQAYIDNGGQAGTGSIYRTGESVMATGVSFGLANPQDLFPGDQLIVKIYRGDGDMDGTLDNDQSTVVDIFDFPPSQVLSAKPYIMTGDETSNELLTVEFPAPVTLDANSLYLVTVETPGFAVNGSPFPPAWSTSGGMNYPDFGTVYRYGNDSEGTFEVDGWEEWNDVVGIMPTFPHGGPHTVVRLHTEGFVFTSTEELLDESKFALNPTLANDYVQLELNLNTNSDVVKMKITDLSGKLMTSLIERNVQNGTYTFDVSDYPAGNYFMSLETREGVNTKKFVVVE